MRPLEVEILFTPTCPHGPAMRRRIDSLARVEGIEVKVTETIIVDARDADARDFPGSPTILVEGDDIEPTRAEAPVDRGLG